MQRGDPRPGVPEAPWWYIPNARKLFLVSAGILALGYACSKTLTAGDEERRRVEAFKAPDDFSKSGLYATIRRAEESVLQRRAEKERAAREKA